VPNYINTIAALVKINKIFKTLKLSNVIWQGNEGKLPEDDTIGGSLIIYTFIIIALSLVDLQIINNARYVY
jgi:hypothetical protein